MKFFKRIPFICLALIWSFACFYAGSFSMQFHQNLCYSEMLSILGENSIKIANSGDPIIFIEWAKFIHNLPIVGYESNCSEILEHVKQGVKNEF